MTTTRTCTFEGCDRPHRAKGWCWTHLRQHTRGTGMHPIIRPVPSLTPAQCTVMDGDERCPNPVKARKACTKHYQRWTKSGVVTYQYPPTIRAKDMKCRITTAGERCGRPCYARGICRGHYDRWLRTGTYTGVLPVRKNLWNLDEVVYLIDGGANLHRLAEAFNVTPDTVLRNLQRNHRNDLIARLSRRAA